MMSERVKAWHLLLPTPYRDLSIGTLHNHSTLFELCACRGGGGGLVEGESDVMANPGGRGGTESLSLGTNCETTAPPPFWTKDSPCFATDTFTAPPFMDTNGQPIEINIE